MLKQKYKDIEAGDKKYRLTKMDARTGSYLAAKVALLAAPLMNSGSVDKQAIAHIVPSLCRKDFEEIQTIVLQRVQRLNEVNGSLLPEPILKADGTFVDEELEYSIATVMNLTVQAIMFNIGDFFAEAGFLKPAQ